ncbi:MAG: ABC transporter ATP-binding protein [Bacillota bacterium]
MSSTALLRAASVSKHFILDARSFAGQRKKAVVKAVDQVSFDIRAGETIAVVGESGCGKTTLMRLLIRLVDVTAGSIWFMDQEVTSLTGKELNRLRRNIQIVFQDPLSSLNPMMNIRNILSEPLLAHTDLRGDALHKRLEELIEMVGLSKAHLWRRPHEFSGGQCQRIAIARAIALNPCLIILDEPTASLDVSVQALILKLLGELQQQLNLTYLFVTHNLSVARCMADRLMVMYLGKVVEEGPVNDLFKSPLHPYTKLLLSSVPSPVPGESLSFSGLLEGGIPSPVNLPAGCRFHPRCPERVSKCAVQEPEMYSINGSRRVYCWLHNSGIRP